MRQKIWDIEDQPSIKLLTQYFTKCTFKTQQIIVSSGIHTSVPLKLCSHLAFDMLELFLQWLILLKCEQNLASCKFLNS